MLQKLLQENLEIDCVLVFLRNQAGGRGIYKAVMRNSKISHLAPVSDSYLRERIDIIAENKTVSSNELFRVLPPNVRYFCPIGSQKGIVFTTGEIVKKCLFLEPGNGKQVEVSISFPKLVAIYAKGELYLFGYRDKQPEADSKLYRIHLPNYDAQGKACFGTVKRPNFNKGMRSVITTLSNCIYDSVFTDHGSCELSKIRKAIESGSVYQPRCKDAVGTFQQVVRRIFPESFNLFNYD